MDTEAHTPEVKSATKSTDEEKVSMSIQFDRNAGDLSLDKLIKPNNESIQGPENHGCSTENENEQSLPGEEAKISEIVSGWIPDDDTYIRLPSNGSETCLPVTKKSEEGEKHQSENEQSSLGEEAKISAIISTGGQIPDEDTCIELPSLDRSNGSETCLPVTEKSEEGENQQCENEQSSLGEEAKISEILSTGDQIPDEDTFIELPSLDKSNGSETCLPVTDTSEEGEKHQCENEQSSLGEEAKISEILSTGGQVPDEDTFIELPSLDKNKSETYLPVTEKSEEGENHQSGNEQSSVGEEAKISASISTDGQIPDEDTCIELPSLDKSNGSETCLPVTEKSEEGENHQSENEQSLVGEEAEISEIHSTGGQVPDEDTCIELPSLDKSNGAETCLPVTKKSEEGENHQSENEQSSVGEEAEISEIHSTGGQVPDEDTCIELPSLEKSNGAETCLPVTEKSEEGEKHQSGENMENLETATKKNEALQDLSEEMERSQYIEMLQNVEITSQKQGHGAGEIHGGIDIEPPECNISTDQPISVESNETVPDVMADGAMGMSQSCNQNAKIDNISSTSTAYFHEEYEESSLINVEKAERTFESRDNEKSPEMTRPSEEVENKSNGNGEATIPAVQETAEAHDDQDNPKVAPEIQNNTEERLESPSYEIEICKLTEASSLEVEVDEVHAYSNVSYEHQRYKEETSGGGVTPIEKINEAGTSKGLNKEEDTAAQKDVSTATEDGDIQFLENAFCTEISLPQKIEKSEENPDILVHTEAKETETAASGENNDISVIVKKSKQDTDEDYKQKGKENEESSIYDDHNLVPTKQLLEVPTTEKTDNGDEEIQCQDNRISMETHEPLIADEGDEKLNEITHEKFESTENKKPDNTNTEGTSEQTIPEEVPGIISIVDETFEQRFQGRDCKEDGEILVDEEKCRSHENDFRINDIKAQKVTEEGRIEEEVEEKIEGSIIETMEASHTVEIERKNLVEDSEESVAQGYEHTTERGILVEENHNDMSADNMSEVNDDKLSKTAEQDQTNQLLTSDERQELLEELCEVISDITDSNAVNEHSEYITAVEGEETILNRPEIVDVHKKEENATDSNKITEYKNTEQEVCKEPNTEITSLNGENQDQDETTDVKFTKSLLVKEEEEELLKLETKEVVTLTCTESNEEVEAEDILEEKVTETLDHIALEKEETKTEKQGQDSDSDFGKESLTTAGNNLSDRVNIENKIGRKSKIEEHENSSDIPEVTFEGSKHLNIDIEEKVHGGSKKKSLDTEEENEDIQTEKTSLILNAEATKVKEVRPKKYHEGIEDPGEHENLVQEKMRSMNDDVNAPISNTENQNEANQTDLVFKSHATTAEFIQEAESSRSKDGLDTNNYLLEEVSEAKIETSSFAYSASKKESDFSNNCQKENDSEHISPISTIGGGIMDTEDIQLDTEKQVQDSDNSLDRADKEERKLESRELVKGNDKILDKDQGGETIEMKNADEDATSADLQGTEKSNIVFCGQENEVHDSLLSSGKQDSMTAVYSIQEVMPTRKEILHTAEETHDFTLLKENEVLQEQEFIRDTDVSNLQKTDSTQGDIKEEMENQEGKSSLMATVEKNDENISHDQGSKMMINEKEADNTSYIADTEESDYGCKMVIVEQKAPASNFKEVSTGASVEEATIESVDGGLTSQLEDTSIQNEETVTPKNAEPTDTTMEFEVARESMTKDQTDENQHQDNINSNSDEDEITESIDENGEKVQGETERLMDLQLNLEHHIEMHEREKPRTGEELEEQILKTESSAKEAQMISDGTDKEIEFVNEREAKNFSEIERSKNLEELISPAEYHSNLAATKVLRDGVSTEEIKRTLSESFNLENYVDEGNNKAETYLGKLDCEETSLNETKKENEQIKYSVAPQEEEEARIQTEDIRSEIVEYEEKKEKISNYMEEKDSNKIYGEGREVVDDITGDKENPTVGCEKEVPNNLTPTFECHVQYSTAKQPEGVQVTSTIISSIKESAGREDIIGDLKADHVVGFLSHEIQGEVKSTIEEDEQAHEPFKGGEDQKIAPQVMNSQLGDKNGFTDSLLDETESEIKKQTRREPAEDEPSKSSIDYEDPTIIHQDSEKEIEVKHLENGSENAGISEHASPVVTIKQESSLTTNTENKEQVIEANGPNLAAKMFTMSIKDPASSLDSTKVNEIQEDGSSINISEDSQLQEGEADASKEHHIHDEEEVTKNEHAIAVADSVPMSANEFPHSSRSSSAKEDFGKIASISAKDEAFSMEGVIPEETEASFLVQKGNERIQKEPEDLSKLEQGKIINTDMIGQIQHLNIEQAETTENLDLSSESITEENVHGNLSHDEESRNTEAQRPETSKPISGEKLLGEWETESHFQIKNISSIKHEHHENTETGTKEPDTLSTRHKADNKMGYQSEATNMTEEERSKTLKEFADPKQYLIALTAAEVFKGKCTEKDKNSISHYSNVMPSLPEKETEDETFHGRDAIVLPEKLLKEILLDETAEENKEEQKCDVILGSEDATISGEEGTRLHIVNTEGIKEEGIKEETSNLVAVKKFHETMHKEKDVVDEDASIHISVARVSHGEVDIGLTATPKDLLQDSARTQQKGESMAKEIGSYADNSKTRDEAATINSGASSELHTTDQTLIVQKVAYMEAEGLSSIENKNLEKSTEEDIEMQKNIDLPVEHVVDDTITKERDISAIARDFNLEEDQTEANISDILRHVKIFKADSEHDPGNSLRHNGTPTLEQESDLAESLGGILAAALNKEVIEQGATSHEHDSTDIKENELLTEKKLSSAYTREDVEFAVETEGKVPTMNEIGNNNLIMEENFQDELKKEVEPKLDGQEGIEVQANEKETRIMDICAEEEREFITNEIKDDGNEGLKEEIVGIESNFTDIHITPVTNEAANEIKETVPDSKEDIEAMNSSYQTTHLSSDDGRDQLNDKSKSATEVVGEQNEDDLRIIDNSAGSETAIEEKHEKITHDRVNECLVVSETESSMEEDQLNCSPLDTTSLNQESQEAFIYESRNEASGSKSFHIDRDSTNASQPPHDQRNAAIVSLLAEDAGVLDLQGIKTAPLVATMAEYFTIEETNRSESKQHVEGLDADSIKDIHAASATTLNPRSANIEEMCEEKTTTDQSLSNDTLTTMSEKTEEQKRETVILIDNSSMDNMAATSISEESHLQKEKSRDLKLFESTTPDLYRGTEENLVEVCREVKNVDSNFSIKPHGVAEEGSILEARNPTDNSQNFKTSELSEGPIHEEVTSEYAKEENHVQTETETITDLKTDQQECCDVVEKRLSSESIIKQMTADEPTKTQAISSESQVKNALELSRVGNEDKADETIYKVAKNKSAAREEAGIIERSTCLSEVRGETQGTGNIHDNHGGRFGMEHACEESELKDAASKEAATQEQTKETDPIKKGEGHGLNGGKAGEHEGVGAVLGEKQIIAASHEDKETDLSTETDDETKTIQFYNQVEDIDDDQGNANRKSKSDTDQEAPIMVEGFKDSDVKVVHKKSHNILSGVGSKVKHSISKVKKALVGKSSHSHQKATST